MAKSVNRGLGALAALGALSYHLSKSGGGGSNRAPVDDRNTGSSRPQETFMGLDDSGAAGDQSDTGDFLSRRLRVNPETGQAYSMDNLSPMDGAAPATGGTRSLAAPSPRAPVAPAGMSAAAMDAGYADRAAPSTAPDAAAMFRAQERAERGTPAMRNPNISEEVSRRTGVRLDSRAGAGRGGQGGPTAAELEEYRNRPYNPPPMTPDMRRQAERQAIQPVYPEEYLAGGPGLKAMHSAAKALANRRPGIAEISQQALPAPTKRLPGPSKGDLATRDRASRAATREEQMLRENAEAYGLNPNAPGYEAAARALREKLGGSEFTLKKKGGAIKTKKMASGGMTSASKRGDGIASKGKTKCKMY